MIRNLYSLFLMLCVALSVSAQSDVSRYYLANPGFDTGCHYLAGQRTAVAQEILDIEGWTADLSADYTITGIYQFGFGGTFNSAIVPASGADGEEGGALALSTGWDQTFCYYQTITLPAGKYTINVPTYNGKTVTTGTSQLAWIPASGTKVASSRSSFPARQWTNDQLTFTLTRSTTGRLQVGYKAGPGPSTGSAALLIDYVQILGQDMAVSKTTLRSTLQKANTALGAADSNADASTFAALEAAVAAAQTVYENSEATMPEVLEANYNLANALEAYTYANASEQHPVDVTSRIQNPSFETNTTAGWTIAGMALQNNTVFSRKAGSIYLESWVGIGQQLGDHSVSQTLSKLPQGNYRLSANALHIQQSGSNSTTNKGTAQTGAYLYAGLSRTAITAMNTYTVAFSVVDETADVEIGLAAEGATGNWLCVDNFKLQYVGAITTESLLGELRQLVERAQQLLDAGVQETAAAPLRTAVAGANAAIGQSAAGGDIASIRAALVDAIAQAEASRARYESLAERIAYAEKVVAWWTDVQRKATACNTLRTAIATAKEKLSDYTLTDAQLSSALSTLNARIAAVDKKIYCSANACGTDAELKKADSYWSYERSLQSKHWILFWEKGYGTAVPDAVPGILENADRIFELYANELGFITINQGSSKTDTYKMIIRLRYTDEWEASGSGIDDQIGLLTLSRWAYTSRAGQTVAHEIGHCFQYQTHCDNGNWNGWMYNWGASTLNVWWEMCAQWQAYKYYPAMQFDNEWLNNTLNGLHRHPLSVDLRYNNYFIQDYFAHQQGIDFIGTLWNKSYNPEDPLQTYMRLTMSGAQSKRIAQLGDEMWEYGARMTTFDLDPIRDYGKNAIGRRTQTSLTKDGDGYWWPKKDNCIENWGNNAIRLNVPSAGRTVYVEFEGKAGATGYNAFHTTSAGWRVGFVALQSDGTRVYGDITPASYADPDQVVAFECPASCRYLWLVVSGAPSAYWTRDWLSWDQESEVEQWPYRVKFYQTNVFGNPNNNSLPTAIDDIVADADPQSTASQPAAFTAVYNLNGQRISVRQTSDLTPGVFIINNRKVIIQ